MEDAANERGDGKPGRGVWRKILTGRGEWACKWAVLGRQKVLGTEWHVLEGSRGDAVRWSLLEWRETSNSDRLFVL